MFRKCSNQELPWMVTLWPGVKVAKHLVFEGKLNVFRDSEELIEGSLHAVELITQILSSSTQDLENSDLVEYTTEQCFKKIVAMSSGNPPKQGDIFSRFDSKIAEELVQKFIGPCVEKKLEETEKHMTETYNLARRNSLIPREDIIFKLDRKYES